MAQVTLLLATAGGLAVPWTVRSVFDHLLAGEEAGFLVGAFGVLDAVSVVRELANAGKTCALGVIS